MDYRMKRNIQRAVRRQTGRLAAGLFAAALLAQPLPALAGPADDAALKGQVSTGPSSAGNSGNTAGPSQGSTPSGGTSSSGSAPVTGGVSAVTSGLGVYLPEEEFGVGAIARGIDVSYWQQSIDWSQVAADNVQFAMLATRFRGNVDPYFDANARGASQAGIRIGAYIYSYATSVQMAEQEADFVLNLIKDYPISFPVVFDAEDASTLGTLSPSEVSDVINAFCRRVEEAGYYPMVYANEYWLTNKIDMSKMHYDVWVARYNQWYTFDSPAMWQRSNTGSVNGISGNVDIDYLYKDFTQVIAANTWRTIGGKRYYYANHVMQKSAWIYDGQNWYYMNAEGTPSTGWLESGGRRYYLEADGKMVTGWRELDGGWRYFDASGAMTTGWQAVDGAWYYLDANGLMQTGWQTIDGKRYYLESDGKMVTGWRDLDGARYYFDAGGAMTTGWQAVDGAWYYLNEAGAMQTGWQEIGGVWYYLNGSGVMQTGWQEIGGARYYLDASGAMATGLRDVDGARYYFDGSGKMAVNTVVTADGVIYVAGADGSCVPYVPEPAAQGETDGAAAPDTESGGTPSGPSGQE